MLNEGPIGLTDREYKIMDILWDSERDLTINEISELSSDPKLSAPCVSQVRPRLLKKGMIHVERFIPVNTKYARTFLADITRQDYLESKLQHLFQKTSIISVLKVLMSAGSPDENDALIQELETFIEDYQRDRNASCTH